MNLKPEELVKALRFCGKHECITCPCDIDECIQMVYAAADQIERDQKEIEALREKLPKMMRIRPGDTVWLSQMFYTRPKKPLPVTVDAIRIDREGVMFITGRRRFSEDAIGKTVFLSKEEAEKALQEMEERGWND